MFPETNLTERAQSGLKKKKSMKGGKWKELVLKMGSDYHSLLLTFSSIMLHFYGKSEEAAFLPIAVCALVSTRWEACVVWGFNLNDLLVWFDICVLTVLPAWSLELLFLHGLSSSTFHFCSKFASSSYPSQFHKYLYCLKWLVTHFIVCFSLIILYCFTDYIIILFYIAERNFLHLFRKAKL